MSSLDSQHVYRYGNKTINYSLVRSRRVKTCEIIINDENSVLIRSPYYKPISEIEDLLKNKMNWISKKQIQYREQENRVEIIKPTFQNNSTVPYLGKNLKLNIIQSYPTKKDSIEFKRNQLFVFLKTDNKIKDHISTPEHRIKSIYEKWLIEESKDIFREKVLGFSKIIGVNPSKITIKNLKNRWGSATKTGTLNLNLNLVKAPEHIIDYIIFHELCHFNIKDHNHKFWAYLHKFVPNYRDYVDWLNVNGKNIIGY